MPEWNCHEGEKQCKWCEEWFDQESLTFEGFCCASCEEEWYQRNMKHQEVIQ